MLAHGISGERPGWQVMLVIVSVPFITILIGFMAMVYVNFVLGASVGGG